MSVDTITDYLHLSRLWQSVISHGYRAEHVAMLQVSCYIGILLYGWGKHLPPPRPRVSDKLKTLPTDFAHKLTI